MVKNCSQSIANGVGVRVLPMTKTGYAYTDDITIENLELAARTAQYIAQNRHSQLPVPVGQLPAKPMIFTRSSAPVNDVALDKKVALLYEIDKFARASIRGSKMSLSPSAANIRLSWWPLPKGWSSAISSR